MKAKVNLEIKELAAKFLELYNETNEWLPDTAKRVGYVESLLQNQYYQIEKLIRAKYSKKYRDSIRKEFEDKYSSKYETIQREIIEDLKQRLDNSVGEWYL